MSKELDYLDKILKYQPLTLVERTIIECIKEKLQRLETIEKALEIIKGKIIWIENDKLMCGRYADVEIELEEEDFENKEEFELLKEWLDNA